MGYLVSEATKVKLESLMNAAPAITGGGSAGATLNRQVTHVYITSDLEGGYYQCIPCGYCPTTGEWTEFTASLVFQPNTKPLAMGNFYLAVRYGVDADGTNIFVTTESDSGGDSSGGSEFDYLDYEITVRWTNLYGALDTGVHMYLPSAGTYILYKQPFWQVVNNTSGSPRLDAVQSWLWDSSKGGTDITYSSLGTIPMTFCYDADTNYYPTPGVVVEPIGKTPVTCLYYTNQPTTIKLIQYHSGGGGSVGDVHTVYLLFAYMWWVKLSPNELPGSTANGADVIVS